MPIFVIIYLAYSTNRKRNSRQIQSKRECVTVSLENYGHEGLKHMSMIEMAKVILLDEKEAMGFKDIFDKIAEVRGFTKSQKETKIVQFYTDLNLDGRFITIGSNVWGLKRWYPVGKIDDEVTTAPKKKKKTAKKATKGKKEKEVEELGLEDEGLDIVDGDIEEVVDGFGDDEVDDDEFDEIMDEELDEEEEEEEEK